MTTNNTPSAPESAIPSSNTPYLGTLSSAQRNEALKALSNAAGIRLPKTIVPEGESLIDIGVASKRRLESELDALPSLAEGLAALSYRVAQEKPQDVQVPIQHVRMEPARAGLFGKDSDASKSLGYTKNGFAHVAAFAKPASLRGGFTSTLLALPPTIRADAFNHFATNATRADLAPVVLRTHLVGVDSVSVKPRRIIRAVVSKDYSMADDLDIMRAAVEGSLPLGAKMRMTRGTDRTDLEIIWPAMKREIKVGDAVMMGVRISNSETKAGSVRVVGQVLRALCFNFTTAYGNGQEEEISIRHVGEARAKIGGAVLKAIGSIEPFIKAFGDAYAVPLPTIAPTRGEVLQLLGKVFKQLPESVIESCVGAWDADGTASAGDTLAGLVNAMTRASQKLSMEEAINVERVAGKLVMQGWAALED